MIEVSPGVGAVGSKDRDGQAPQWITVRRCNSQRCFFTRQSINGLPSGASVGQQPTGGCPEDHEYEGNGNNRPPIGDLLETRDALPKRTSVGIAEHRYLNEDYLRTVGSVVRVIGVFVRPH